MEINWPSTSTKWWNEKAEDLDRYQESSQGQVYIPQDLFPASDSAGGVIA